MLITGQDLLAKKPLAKSDIYVRFCRVGAERVKRRSKLSVGRAYD